MKKNRKFAIKITSFILTFMYIIWAICFINVITSCNKNIYHTNGIVINWEELKYKENAKIYTKSENKYNKNNIVLVNNIYANIITKIVINRPINEYWYEVIFINNTKKRRKKLWQKITWLNSFTQ